MSDLRERLIEAGVEAVEPKWREEFTLLITNLIDAQYPIIEAELQKRDQEIERLEEADQRWLDRVVHYRNVAISLGATPEQMDDDYDRQLSANWERNRVALNEANKLLEQTIEVLETWNDYEGCTWWFEKAMPLLDNLKALKKEGAE